MSAPAEIALKEPTFNTDKLSYEIFSILESKFLFGYGKSNHLLHAAPPQTVSAASSSTGRIRILSVDTAGATDGLLAAASLAQLESSLEKLSGVAPARIADFFDVAAGSGVGGVLVALLFTRGHGGRPLLSAAEALEFIARNRRALQPAGKKKGPFSGIFRRKGAPEPMDRILRRIFGESTLRDTLKPVLIPCYDLSTGAPFLFSRADAIETVRYDFLIREVCAATIDAARMRSVDGKTAIDAVDGGVAAGNPAAAAITHVLNNRIEFPFVASVEDLLVLSLGNGESVPACGGRREKKRSPALLSEILRIAGEGASDMVQNPPTPSEALEPLNPSVQSTRTYTFQILTMRGYDSLKLFHIINYFPNMIGGPGGVHGVRPEQDAQLRPDSGTLPDLPPFEIKKRKIPRIRVGSRIMISVSSISCSRPASPTPAVSAPAAAAPGCRPRPRSCWRRRTWSPSSSGGRGCRRAPMRRSWSGWRRSW